MQESFRTIDQSTTMDVPMNSKKAIIIAILVLIVFAVVGVYVYKSAKPKGLTEKDRQAFTKYVEQYQKDHPTPALTQKEQQAFVAYVNSGKTETTTSSKTKEGSKTQTSSTPVLTSDQQQAFINYVNAQAK